ncbi:unnamed protein product [Rotaria sp. Silwood1]|nr:unnamed protein product [Rotaria sp. Silwood1]
MLDHIEIINDFPILSENDVYSCKDFPDLIRVSARSVHVNRTTYNSVIKFSPDEVLDWWYDYPMGNVPIGSCSHIASTVCFLCCQRWKLHNRRIPIGDFIQLATDANQLSDLYDSTDDEVDFN